MKPSGSVKLQVPFAFYIFAGLLLLVVLPAACWGIWKTTQLVATIAPKPKPPGIPTAPPDRPGHPL